MEQSGDLVLSGTENEYDDPCLDRTNEGCRRRRRLTNIWYDVWNSNTSHIMADQSGESVPKFTINADGTMSIWEFMDQNASSNSARLLWTQNTNVSGNDLVLTLNAGGCLSLIHNEADSVGTEWTFCGSFIWRRTTTLSVDQNGLGDDNKIESNDGEKRLLWTMVGLVLLAALCLLMAFYLQVRWCDDTALHSASRQNSRDTLENGALTSSASHGQHAVTTTVSGEFEVVCTTLPPMAGMGLTKSITGDGDRESKQIAQWLERSTFIS